LYVALRSKVGAIRGNLINTNPQQSDRGHRGNVKRLYQCTHLRSWTSFINTIISMMMRMSPLEAQSTISARSWSGLIQIDKDFRMSQWSTPTVAGSDPSVAQNNRLVIDDLHRAEGCRLKFIRNLFKARGGSWWWAGLLRCRPRLRFVWSLGDCRSRTRRNG